MQLPSLHNATSATAGLFPCVVQDGWALLVVIKQAYAFELDGSVVPVSGAAIRHGDEPWGDAGVSSTQYPHDLAPLKANTDVVIVGDALTSRGQLLKEMPIRAEVGSLALSAHVFGPRTWVDAGHGIVPTSPLPFSRAELRWEHAFGGLDTSDPNKVLEEPRNPIGRGLASDPRQLIATATPHVEDPANPIRDHRTRPAPIGFGALGPLFEPRRTAAGTHDAEWTRHRMPMPPTDQDDSFHQVSYDALRADEHMQGGEPVRLLGMHERGVLSFDLPQSSFLVAAPETTGMRELIATLDTIVIEPNQLRFEIAWRASFPWPHPPSRKNVVRVSSLGAS